MACIYGFMTSALVQLEIPIRALPYFPIFHLLSCLVWLSFPVKTSLLNLFVLNIIA